MSTSLTERNKQVRLSIDKLMEEVIVETAKKTGQSETWVATNILRAALYAIQANHYQFGLPLQFRLEKGKEGK